MNLDDYGPLCVKWSWRKPLVLVKGMVSDSLYRQQVKCAVLSISHTFIQSLDGGITSAQVRLVCKLI